MRVGGMIYWIDRSIDPPTFPQTIHITPQTPTEHTHFTHSVVEEGDHNQLLARGGLYARMYEMQHHQHSKARGNGGEGVEEEGEDEEEQRRKKRAAWDHRLEKA